MLFELPKETLVYATPLGLQVSPTGGTCYGCCPTSRWT